MGLISCPRSKKVKVGVLDAIILTFTIGRLGKTSLEGVEKQVLEKEP